MLEAEVKILEVDPIQIFKTLRGLDAKQVLNTRLYVDWYHPYRKRKHLPPNIALRLGSAGLLVAENDIVSVSDLDAAKELIAEITTEQTDPWYLRIRQRKDADAEVTWKGQQTISDGIRRSKEINLQTTTPRSMAKLFKELGLKAYAHQEKNRTSWIYQYWRIDLDRYPGIPPYLEIEGKDSDHIQEAIVLLDLTGHECTPEGEVAVIQGKYGVDWKDMRFSK